MRHFYRNLKRAGLLAALTIPVLALLNPVTGSAFGIAGVGPRVGSVDPDGMDATFAAGAHLDFEQPGSHVHLIPNIMFWNKDGFGDVNPNFDVMYHFGAAGEVSPYVGAGGGLHFYSSDGPSDPGTDPSANFFGGLLVPTRAFSLFVEGRAVVSDRDEFGILTGATFPLNR